MYTQPIPLINEKSSPGRRGVMPPAASAEERREARARIPANLRRKTTPAMPEVSELEAMRHFTRLSQKNFSIDGQFYPLGSCTMKYNPRINEKVAAMPGFQRLHPMQEEDDIQGSLRIFHDLQEILKQVLGLDAVTLAPAAGAQGEFTGMAIIKAFHEANGQHDRDEVLIPDSAHGTNPASAVLAGFKVKEVKSNAEGRVDLDSLRAAVSEKTAGIMLTNPNTCGVFEKDIREIAKIVHEAGGLLYYDGANLNAIVGRARPGDMGFDVVHMNLHKTFSTPHGGGGPGAGPVGVAKRLVEFLPEPHVKKVGVRYSFYRPERSIGRMMGFHGNAGVLVRALSYALMQGGKGFWDVATYATLNANYVLNNLPPIFERPFGDLCKHEALVSVEKAEKEKGVKAFDIAKRLLDLNFHSPTVYFPLVVHECFLIEPTETESRETLDNFIAAMDQIADEFENNPDILKSAPNNLPTGRLDEASAARELNVCCRWDYSETNA